MNPGTQRMIPSIPLPVCTTVLVVVSDVSVLNTVVLCTFVSTLGVDEFYRFYTDPVWYTVTLSLSLATHKILHVVLLSCPHPYSLNVVTGGVCMETTTHEPHCDYYSTYTDLRLDGRCYRVESEDDGCLVTEEMIILVSE